jgi:adenylate kinase|tara:strand:+ start:22126 stop:22779 length:654 start_codon:yes stop_codon:yes gene_type:complete
MKFVFLGPPGIGKGTQAKILADQLDLAHLSTGDILREEINQETALGEKAQSFMNAGKLVPDYLILDMISKKLQQNNENRGYILDGFPRTVPQAEGLEKMLEMNQQKLELVVYLSGSNDVLVKRLSSRRTCRECETITNLIFNPPKKEGECDNCGGLLFQRDDDNPDVVLQRLKVYQDQTSPLIDFYRNKMLLSEVNGEGSVNDITGKIQAELKEKSG